jgi:uncharacterized membrane protein YphA (DoxX/SURF4 family)
MFQKRILHVYAFIIGLFFLISGIGKVTDIASFSELIYQYGLGYLMVLSPLIALIEILLGILLILLINPKRYSLFALVLLILFTISFAYGYSVHGITDCGCLGTLQPTTISPVFSFTRNLILIIMALIVLIKYPIEVKETAKWKMRLIVAVMVPAIFLAGLTFEIPPNLQKDNSSVIHKLKNQRIQNTELSNLIKTSQDSSYLIFCFSYTCPSCLNSIENLRQYQKSNTVDRIVAFATGDESGKLSFYQNFSPDFYIKDIPLDSMLKLTDLFPTIFYVEHDSIKAVIEGELPSHVIFKNKYINSIKKI